MSLNLEQKKAVVAEVGQQVASAQAIVIAEYRGITVDQVTVLRKKAREQGVYLKVLKNTLVRRAVENTPFAGLADQMVGPLIYGIGDDILVVSKVINDFAKGNDKLVIKAGALPNEVLDVDTVKAYASLPSREELLAKLLGTLNEVPSRFARTLAAIRDQKEGTPAEETTA